MIKETVLVLFMTEQLRSYNFIREFIKSGNRKIIKSLNNKCHDIDNHPPFKL